MDSDCTGGRIAMQFNTASQSNICFKIGNMNRRLTKTSPYLLIFVGLFLLFYMGMAMPAGICLLIGIVMVFERIWPEKWGLEK